MKKIRIKLTKGGVKIIKRTILSKITDDLKNWPVVLITSARQVGKTTICNILEKELDYNYISLDNTRNRFDALANKTNMPIGFKCIICLTNSIYSLGNDTYAIPIASI